MLPAFVAGRVWVFAAGVAIALVVGLFGPVSSKSASAAAPPAAAPVASVGLGKPLPRLLAARPSLPSVESALGTLRPGADPALKRARRTDESLSCLTAMGQHGRSSTPCEAAHLSTNGEARATVAALAGPSVAISGTAISSTGTVGLTAQATGRTTQFLAIYEPNGPTGVELVAGPFKTDTLTATVTPRATSGEWVAVLLSSLPSPQGSWASAQSVLVAQSPTSATSPAWEVKITGPGKAETNYSINTVGTSNAEIFIYDVENAPVSLTDFCAQTTIPGPGQSPTCAFGIPSQPPSCTLMATVARVQGTPGFYPDRLYAVSNTWPCPEPGPCFVCWVADPVDSMSGSFSESFVDVSIPGRGYGLSLTRRYTSSYAAQQGWFGYGWSSNYEVGLRTEPIISSSAGTLDRVSITYGAGPATIFIEKPDHTFTSPVGVYQGLERFQGGWKLSEWKSRTAWIFDATGNLTDIVDRNGELTHLDYNTTTNKITVTEQAGRTLVLAFNGPRSSPASRVTSVTDPTGRVHTYTYEPDGDLDTARDAANVLSTFDYQVPSTANPPHLLTNRTTGKGGYVANTYQQYGSGTAAVHKVISQTIKVDTANTAFPNKHLRTTTFAYTGTPLKGAGSTTVTDDHGVPTRYSYTNGQLTQATSNVGKPDEATTSYVMDGLTRRPIQVTSPNQKTTTITYDALGNIKTITDPLQHVTEMVYNASGQLTCAVNPYQHEKNVTCPSSGGPVPAGAAGMTYDANGNLTSVTDPNGHTTTLTLDPDHPQDVRSVTDPEGRVFTYDYDPYGNIALATATPVTGTVITSQTKYDTASRPYCTVSPTQYSLNVRCPAANATTWPAGAERYEYSTTSGLVSAYTNAKGGKTSYAYDADANLTSISNSRGTQTATYDLAHRPLTVTEASGTTYAMTTTMVYDAQDAFNATVPKPCTPDATVGEVWCTTSKDSAAKTTTSYYTARGQLARMVTPGNSTQKATYRADGLPLVVTLPGGRTLTGASFDEGRLKSLTSSVAGTSPISYTYRADGLRATMTDGTGTSSYAWDDAGLLTSATNANGTVGYSWDTSNRLKNITYPSGRVVTRDYDGAGRFYRVNDGAGHATTFDLFPDGDIQRINYPNTLKATITRDQLGGMLTNTVANAAGTTQASLTWARSNFGLVTSETGTGWTTTSATSYGYDNAWRMTTAGTGAYTFDTGDHLTALGGPTQTFTTNGSGRLATSTNGSQKRSYTYTDANLTASTLTAGTGNNITAVFDGANRMTRATVTPTNVLPTTYDYTYDGDNLRLTRTTGGTTTRYNYSLADGIPSLISEANLDYIYGPDGLPIEQIGGTDNSNPTYFTHDQHGDTRILTDQNGAQSAVYRHTPYGVSTKTSGTGSTTLLYGTGHTDTDTDTGYTYLINRYYDPATGQFTTPDPPLPPTRPPYSYGDHSPLNTIDPFGLDTLSPSIDEWVERAIKGGIGWSAGGGAYRSLINRHVKAVTGGISTRLSVFGGSLAGAGGQVVGQAWSDHNRTDLSTNQKGLRLGVALLIGLGAGAAGGYAAALGVGLFFGAPVVLGVAMTAAVSWVAYLAIDYLTDHFFAAYCAVGDWNPDG